jgi:hypothetical protein
MRLSTLVPATFLLFCPFVMAQHGGGGGGGGGGGSHGGSSGGGGYSSGGSAGHSSGGSSSHGSSSHGSSAHGSSAESAHSTSRLNNSLSRHEQSFPRENHESLAKPQHEKPDLVSLLRHPFRKHHIEAAGDLPRHLCLYGLCSACPTGQTRVGGACVAPRIVYQNNRNTCSHWDVWVGDPCLANTHFIDECGPLWTMLDQQAARLNAAELDRQSACSAGKPECSALTSRSQSEASLYLQMQARYTQCRQHPGAVSPFGDAAQADIRAPLFEPR